MNELKLITTRSEFFDRIRDSIVAQAMPDREIQILEAGCGNSWSIQLDDVKFHLTGVDLDEAALALRVNVKKDLDEMIHADLRTVDLGNRQFDVVYNSFVLEHISGAEQVLDRFMSWLRPNGILIILIPDPNSAYGFVTKMTPHWFHVLFYKFVLRIENSGKPGYPPYRTYYDNIVSRAGISEYCQRNNVKIEAEFGDGFVRPGKGFMQSIVTTIKRALRILSAGRLSDRHTNLLYVLRRSPESTNA